MKCVPGQRIILAIICNHIPRHLPREEDVYFQAARGMSYSNRSSFVPALTLNSLHCRAGERQRDHREAEEYSPKKLPQPHQRAHVDRPCSFVHADICHCTMFNNVHWSGQQSGSAKPDNSFYFSVRHMKKLVFCNSALPRLEYRCKLICHDPKLHFQNTTVFC